MEDSASRLLDAVRRLNQSLDPSQVLLRVCEEATRLLDADNASVFLGSASDGVRAEATYGGPRRAHRRGCEGGRGTGRRRGGARRVGACGRAAAGKTGARAHHALAVPLRWDGRLRGVLAVGFEHEQSVSRDELGLLEEFGELAATACRNASAHGELARAARTDALTGCLNHSAMQDALGREVERCRRKGHALSLVIVDLDEFKEVNERHGHLAGDEVLRQVGESLRESVRAYDLVARYGGDEFAVIAMDADEATATEVARRAVEAIASALGTLGPLGSQRRPRPGWPSGRPGTRPPN